MTKTAALLKSAAVETFVTALGPAENDTKAPALLDAYTLVRLSVEPAAVHTPIPTSHCAPSAEAIRYRTVEPVVKPADANDRNPVAVAPVKVSVPVPVVSDVSLTLSLYSNGMAGHSEKILKAPLSHCTTTSPPFVVSGKPVIVSM